MTFKDVSKERELIIQLTQLIKNIMLFVWKRDDVSPTSSLSEISIAD